MGWTAGNRGFLAGGSFGTSTGSLASSGSNRLLRAWCYIGTGATPADPTGVAWDAAGVNEAFTSFQTGVTWNTNFRANPWHRKNPTAKTATATVTYASSHDEVMIICDAYQDIDQTTTTRTPPSMAQGHGNTPSLNVTSVSGDIVVGSVAFSQGSDNLTNVTSGSVTVRETVAGTDINSPASGGYESCGQGDTTASSTTTSVGFTAGVLAGTCDYLLAGVALIPDAGGGAANDAYLTMPPVRPPMGGSR